MAHHLIFEGAELVGKSYIMSQIYNYLESKYNESGFVLDGCHWLNSDIGIYGTKYGQAAIEKYVELFAVLKEKNLIIEKLHLSDAVYNRLHRNREIDYRDLEKKLSDLNFKIILITFPEDKNLLQQRINDRINLYPHYRRILKTPQWYIGQQQEYLKEAEKTSLPVLKIEAKHLPDPNIIKNILDWISE